jgi:hypothetical protein
MFVAPEEDPRTDGGFVGEKATLAGFLRDHRLTLELKCAGLSADSMARRSVPPSNLSLLGLVRHLARVEHYWFRLFLAGRQEPRLFSLGDDGEDPFDDAAGTDEDVARAWKLWREQVAFAEELFEQVTDLDATVRHSSGKDLTVREVVLHMIEEYARHAGHADLLRECIDGRVGQ